MNSWERGFESEGMIYKCLFFDAGLGYAVQASLELPM
jgi:hypothetical protein